MNYPLTIALGLLLLAASFPGDAPDRAHRSGRLVVCRVPRRRDLDLRRDRWGAGQLN